MCKWGDVKSAEEFLFFFFFDLRGCPGQLARTTTNPTVH
jgi:hypothetical protein